MTSLPELGLVELTPLAPDRPLLVVGPSLGTAVRTLWAPVAARLDGAFSVLGWDLPGHGTSAAATGFDVGRLAAAVLEVVDRRVGEGTTFSYAGDSLGAVVGLQLLLDAPARVRSATLCCTGPRIGSPGGWRERAAAVRGAGTSVLLEATPTRWFAPGFAKRAPALAAALLADLEAADDDSYAAACDALAAFDIRSRLAEVATPVVAVAGDADQATPAALLGHLAAGVQHGRLVVLDGVGHLAPAEAPDQVATLIAEQTGAKGASATVAQVRAEGLQIRRQVLGDAHVDRALASATDLTAEFQDFITTYAWGSVWTRPGLDRRSRSIITLTALVARGHLEELAMHVRAARTNGLSDSEIGEVFLQCAIYCGVPDANNAFRIAQRVLAELADPTDPEPERA